jgi:type III secretion protein U
MSGEKTEQPTQHKIDKAREEGQVAKSKDFTQTLLLGALFSYTLIQADELTRGIGEMLLLPAQLYGMEFRAALSILTSQLLRRGIEVLMPYLLLVIVVAIFAEVMQTGLLIAFKSLIPKGEKLNPVTNLKQMFSLKSLVQILKSILKVIFLTSLVYFVIRNALDPLIKIPAAGIGAAGTALFLMLKQLVIYTFIGFGAIALMDLVYQRKRHIKDLMMSMQEIKQEYKQLEGDPEVKHHRKEMSKEIAMGDGSENTEKSTVVVTNPTHLAVALYYEENETPLPVVMAMGADRNALRMIAIAREANIPVMQNIALARALTKSAKLYQYIPSELIEPVAEVLLALKRLAMEEPEEFA